LTFSLRTPLKCPNREPSNPQRNKIASEDGPHAIWHTDEEIDAYPGDRHYEA
jgi:hypothetical protein